MFCAQPDLWRDMHECAGFGIGPNRGRRMPCFNLVKPRLTDDWQHMLNSIVVRAHSQATGASGELMWKLLVGHAAALRAKSHARCDNQGHPQGLVLTRGRSRTTEP